MIRCYGIVPLRREANEWTVLLVFHRKGFWGLPKGHGEAGETPQQSAVRELFEETGLHIVEFLSWLPFEEHYTVNDEPKIVSYYAALVAGEIVLQAEEIEHAQWMSLSTAIAQATFAGNLLKDVSAKLVR